MIYFRVSYKRNSHFPSVFVIDLLTAMIIDQLTCFRCLKWEYTEYHLVVEQICATQAGYFLPHVRVEHLKTPRKQTTEIECCIFFFVVHFFGIPKKGSGSSEGLCFFRVNLFMHPECFQQVTKTLGYPKWSYRMKWSWMTLCQLDKKDIYDIHLTTKQTYTLTTAIALYFLWL